MIVTENLLFLSFLFLFGTLFGSFASVLIHRISNNESGIATGRSKCPKCEHQLAWYDLFPIFSWVFLGGKCRYCKAPIPWSYPFLELTMGVVFVAMWSISAHPAFLLSGMPIAWWRLVFHLFVGFVLVVVSAYDLKCMEVPVDILVKSIIGLTALAFIDSILPQPLLFSHYFLSVHDAINIPIVNGMLGALAIFLFFEAQILASSGRWLGGGDVYIGVFMGLAGGLKIGLLGLFLGYIIGGLFGIVLMVMGKSSQMAIPFGPFLSAGLLAAFLYADYFAPFFPIFAL